MVVSGPQAQKIARAATFVSTATTTLTASKIRNVWVARQRLRNFLLCLDSSDEDQTITTLCHRLADCVCSFSLTLRTNDARLPLLLCLLDDEPRPFSLLLCNLLLLDSPGELLSECHVRD